MKRYQPYMERYVEEWNEDGGLSWRKREAYFGAVRTGEDGRREYERDVAWNHLSDRDPRILYWVEV